MRQVISPRMEPLVVSNFLLCFPFQYSFGISGGAGSAAVLKHNCVRNGKRRGNQGDGKQDSSTGPASRPLPAAFCLGSVRGTAGVLFVIGGLLLVIYNLACTP